MKQDAFIRLLEHLNFCKDGDTYAKIINGTKLAVNVAKEEIIYPKNKGMIINERQTCNFSASENFVVFECVHRLLQKGYKPEHLELERKWKVGHGASGGRADILVKNHQNEPLLLIECKTAGREFDKAWRKTEQNGGQLFSYAQQIPKTEYLCLYASDFAGDAIFFSHKIISHKDNLKILEENPKLASFEKEGRESVERKYKVWKDTYQLEHTEKGIFEKSVQSYHIGKNKYTLEEDTKSIDARDKDGKHHEFRAILRKHNIARRETAFEVLVNLFLCKIVDEEGNPEDLKFYWKGVAYDNHFDFVDRLLSLYQRGMDKFLNEKISYISNEQIDSAFWTAKGGRNATKKQIQKYFREIKFFTNSAFSFVDTHNRELFDKNAEVLKEVVQMWQGMRLKDARQNQFLGDMFEFFLDNGIKQSNGQFFTPLPICKFIVGALPLETKIAALEEPPRVIDYACGAGHFLNEYAHQILPFVKKGEKPAEYYKNIIGVEKEYRLAKVAKIAAYMYGQGEIRILDVDALSEHEDIHSGNYDVLVANPPFAVEGFLQTLGDEGKRRYELIEVTSESSDTDVIECFFLERVCHLMAPEGVVGVIVPSGILSDGDAVHTRTRELLLRFFDFVAIVELGGGTFGKTGISTNVLFLRRKTQKPECFQHYKNRVEDFFEGDIKNETYQDEKFIKEYCRHIEIPYEEYTKLLLAESGGKFKDLLQFEIFKEYRRNWEKSTEIINFKKTKKFQEKDKNEQQAELDKRFLGYLQEREKDKLLYFILAQQQTNKVLIVNAPSDKEKQKQKEFLGYEWVTRKRSEGIKYISGNTVNDIVTPMFDPENLDNPDKINTAIRRNFTGELSGELPGHCRLTNFVDMLDFSRVGFDKAISTNPQKNITIETKWELAKLGDIATTQYGYTANAADDGEVRYLRITDITEEGRLKDSNKRYISPSDDIKNDFLLRDGDIVIARSGSVGRMFLYKNIGEELIFASYLVRLKTGRDVLPEYVFAYHQTGYYWEQVDSLKTKLAQPNLNANQMGQIKIPLPPLKVQRTIVSECEAVDKEMEKSRKTIAANKQKIAEKMQEIINAGHQIKKLGDVLHTIESGNRPKGGVGNISSGAWSLGGEHIHPNNGKVYLKNPKYVPVDFYEKSQKGTLKEDDILLCKDGALTGKIALLEKELNNKMAMVNEHVFILRGMSLIEQKYIFNFLFSIGGQALLKQNITGSAQGGLNVTNLKQIKIPIPSLKVQQKLVAELKKLEEKITEAQSELDTAPARKNAILEKHLQGVKP